MTTKIRSNEWQIDYRYNPRTRINRDLDRTVGRRARRPKRTRFVVRFDAALLAIADGLRWIADVIDRGRL